MHRPGDAWRLPYTRNVEQYQYLLWRTYVSKVNGIGLKAGAQVQLVEPPSEAFPPAQVNGIGPCFTPNNQTSLHGLQTG